jgi:DNA-binding response OmpR family regulator
MDRKAVLIIDDDPELLRQLVAAFPIDRYTVHSASDGANGLRLFRADPPDVVITDLIMPIQEGIETIVAIRSARTDVKIVAMSGGGQRFDASILKAAEHLGADRVIAKPFRHSSLLALVDELVAPSAAVP